MLKDKQVNDTEIIFLVKEDPEGGYTARSLGESIFTQADDLETLRKNVRDAVQCHYPVPEERPRIIQHGRRVEGSKAEGRS